MLNCNSKVTSTVSIFCPNQPQEPEDSTTDNSAPKEQEDSSSDIVGASQDCAAASEAAEVGILRNVANMERTFIMLKPDAVQRGLMGEIIERFEARGFKLVALKFMNASADLLKTHYGDLSKKAFFPELIRYMGSGPVVPMVFEGLNAVKQGRTMLGATNPKDSAPGTIRGDLCIDVGRNIIHGSDSTQSAAKEIALWFTEAELTKWRPHQVEWVYEEEELESNTTKGPAPASVAAKPV